MAIAITLLVLDLAIPDGADTAGELWLALLNEWPGYLGYVVSFSSIGLMWVAHNLITESLERADPVLMRLNLVFLLFVGLLPFVTGLLPQFFGTSAEVAASTIYGATLFVCAALLSALWRYALRAKLVRPDLSSTEVALLTSRLTPGLGGYVLMIVVGVFLPTVAVFGYLVIAILLLLPLRFPRRKKRARTTSSARG